MKISRDITKPLITAATSAVSQYAANGKIDGKVVAYSAIRGAFVGLTGMVGKAAKFLSKFPIF